MRKIPAVMLCAAVLATGCASAAGTRLTARPGPGVADPAAMADYLQRLPAGSKVRVERSDGASLRGTLMTADGESAVVQESTRVPEPPIRIPIERIARVTVETAGGTSTAKAIGLGVASGIGVFFAILAILAGSWSD